MKESELCYLSLSGLAERIRQRQVSPVEVTEVLLARLDQLDRELNSFITITRDEARQQAREAEAEIRAGRYRGPLHGVPFSLKDLYATRGIRTTFGSKILADWIPDYDATVTERLREAGAVLLGKNNLHEFAFGSTTINPHWGPAHNPWDRQRIPAGSSGGSGAAVAAGLSYFSMGSETGASIRRPASFNGVVGLKPTYGRVSKFGMLPAAWSLDHAGPLTRSVADAAIVLAALAGHDPRDPASSRRPVADYLGALDRPVAGLRFGVPAAFFVEGVTAEVSRAFARACVDLEGLGLHGTDMPLPAVQYAALTSSTVMTAEVTAHHRGWLRTRPGDYGADIRTRILLGAAITASDYLKAQRARRAIGRELAAAFEQVDVLVCPTTAFPATLISEGSAALGDRAYEIGPHPFNWVRLPSLLGLPVVSLPCGFTAGGLPLAMQVIGRPFAEETVLQVAHAYESTHDWQSRRPPLSSS